MPDSVATSSIVSLSGNFFKFDVVATITDFLFTLVVTPAEKLISIIPIDAPLVIKAQVINKDIGFINDNINVSIKIETFSFQKYGFLKGLVKKISKDSIEDEKLGPIYDVYIEPLTKTLVVEDK